MAIKRHITYVYLGVDFVVIDVAGKGRDADVGRRHAVGTERVGVRRLRLAAMSVQKP